MFVQIPRAVLEGAPPGAALTLKIRIRALDLEGPFAPGGDTSPVLNDLPEIVVSLCDDAACTTSRDELMGRHGLSLLLDPAAASPFAGVRAVVHLALFANTPEEVADAFAAIDNPALLALPCGSLDCAHLPLATLQALGAYSVTLEELGRSDADIVLYPLAAPAAEGGTDIDLDADTIPGARALAGPATTDCLPYLADPDAPWNRQPVPACESIFDADHLDCNDNAIATNPFEVETSATGLQRCLDGDDQDCDGADDPCPDGDGDGIPLPEDCDDGDPTVYPGALEDGENGCSDAIDQDCDGADVACACDLDGDGFCPEPVAGIAGGDCCESGTEAACGGALPATVGPAAQEICGNGRDDNCDGFDPPCLSPDADGDGHCSQMYACAIDCATADPDGPPLCCVRRATLDPTELAACAGVFDDCADWDSGQFAGLMEICEDGIDQDCDGVDAGCAGDDGDGDGWGATTGDCDDTLATVHPGAGEICGNGPDEDCAGGDVPCDVTVDADGDLYVVCVAPATTGCDCNDTDPAVHPGAPEACNDLDDDCDGVLNEGNPIGTADPVCYGNPPETATPFFVPALPDETWRCRAGRTACSPAGTLVCVELIEPVVAGADDCNDDPICNGRNDVCVVCADGSPIPDAERDLDGDGCIGGCATAPDLDNVLATVGDLCAGIDCNDFDGSVRPGAPEICANDNIDNDCDGDWMENCSAAPGPETCDGADQDCDCLLDASDPDAQAWCPGGTYCDGDSCEPGCDTDSDCTNGNTCATPPACGCGVGPACTGNFTCTGGLCLCGGSGCGPVETCSGSSDCTCGGAFNPSGEACPNSSIGPDCTASGCRCENALCGAGEACSGPGGDCTCGAIVSPGGEACPGTVNPTCVAGACACDAASTCDLDESCSSGACTCGATAPATGPACPNSDLANPNCAGGGCACDAGSFCDYDETCSGGACACGSSAPASGVACPDSSSNPDCVPMGGTDVCGCGDSASICDTDETCAGGGCECGSFVAASGQACPDAGPNPNCAGGNCQCDGDSVCAAGEACASGSCTCGGASMPSGPACPLGMACSAGVCVVPMCPLFACLSGWSCTSGECLCNSDDDCRIGGTVARCRSGGLCDCDGGGSNAACSAGESCFGNMLNDCECLQATCL